MKNEYYFDTRTATIALEAADKTLGLEPVEITVNQMGGDVVYDGKDHTVDTDGHLTLTTTARVTSRFNLKGNKRKFAIYEWKFSDTDFTDDHAIDLNLDGKPAAHMWMGPNVNFPTNSYKFQIAGSLYSLIENKVNKDSRNKMHTLRVEIKPLENNANKASYDVFLNDEKVMDTVEIDISAIEVGYTLYFGFHTSSMGTASMTISSFEVIPVE